MAIRWLLLFGLIVVIGFSLREVLSWNSRTGLDRVSPRQRSLRYWGLILLITFVAMGLGGTYLPVPVVVGRATSPQAQRAVLNYLGYWLFTGLIFIPLIPIALADARENLTRLAEERQKLIAERDELNSIRISDDTAQL